MYCSLIPAGPLPPTSHSSGNWCSTFKPLLKHQLLQEVWPSSSTLPSLGWVSVHSSWNSSCPLPCWRARRYHRPWNRELQLWVYWIWKAQVLSWLVEALGVPPLFSFAVCICMEGSCYSDWFLRPHCSMGRGIVPGGNMVSWVSLLFLHLLLDTAG